MFCQVYKSLIMMARPSPGCPFPPVTTFIPFPSKLLHPKPGRDHTLSYRLALSVEGILPTFPHRQICCQSVPGLDEVGIVFDNFLIDITAFIMFSCAWVDSLGLSIVALTRMPRPNSSQRFRVLAVLLHLKRVPVLAFAILLKIEPKLVELEPFHRLKMFPLWCPFLLAFLKDMEVNVIGYLPGQGLNVVGDYCPGGIGRADLADLIVIVA